MYKETNFELISPGESAIERSSAEEGGFPLRPWGHFEKDAPIVEHPSIEETAEVALISYRRHSRATGPDESASDSVTGTFDMSVPRAGSR